LGDSAEAWDSAFPNLRHESEGGHFPSRLSLSLRHLSRFSDPHVDPAGYAERMSVVISTRVEVVQTAHVEQETIDGGLTITGRRSISSD
jgi:hypothetical protein